MSGKIPYEIEKMVLHMILNNLWNVRQTAQALLLTEDNVRRILCRAGYTRRHGRWISKKELMEQHVGK